MVTTDGGRGKAQDQFAFDTFVIESRSDNSKKCLFVCLFCERPDWNTSRIANKCKAKVKTFSQFLKSCETQVRRITLTAAKHLLIPLEFVEQGYERGGRAVLQRSHFSLEPNPPSSSSSPGCLLTSASPLLDALSISQSVQLQPGATWLTQVSGCKEQRTIPACTHIHTHACSGNPSMRYMDIWCRNVCQHVWFFLNICKTYNDKEKFHVHIYLSHLNVYVNVKCVYRV